MNMLDEVDSLTCKDEILYYPARLILAKIYTKFDAFRLAEKYADVTIKCEDKLFKCHRIILAAASDNFDTVFCKTFDKDNQQTKTPKNRKTIAPPRTLDVTFDLKDFVSSDFVIRADIFEKIIQFVYKGCVEITTADHWREFLQASESLKLCYVEELYIEYTKTDRMSVQGILEVLKFPFGNHLVSELCYEVAGRLRIFCSHDMFPQIPFELFSSILKMVRVRPSEVYNNDDVLLNSIIRWVLHDRVERLPHLDELFKHLRGPRNGFENVSPATMKFTFSQLLKLVSPAIADPTLNDQLSSHTVSYHRAEQTSVVPKKMLYVYIRPKGENLMGVFSIHRRADGQNECRDVGRIRGWQITQSHNPWIRSVAVNNRLYNLYYGRRSSAEDKETENQSFDYCTTELDSTMGLRPAPVIFDDLKLCAMRNKYIYAYNQTLSRRRHRLAASANAQDWTTFTDEEIATGIYMYHCELDRWFPVPAMEERVADACMAVHEDRLYLIGGKDPTDTVKRIVQAYDFRAGNWQNLAHSNTRWFLGADCCALNDRIYVTGGVCDIMGPMVAEYNINADKWVTTAQMSTKMQYHRMLPYAGGELWAMGSFDEKKPSSGNMSITVIDTKMDSNQCDSPIVIGAGAAQTIGGNVEGIILDAVSFE